MSEDTEFRRQRREQLAQFYESEESAKRAGPSPTLASGPIQDSVEKKRPNIFDINGPDFDADAYMQRLIKEANLYQLMAKENDIVKEIHSLDSDMQTLVYENYNKFISATDTINKMRVDFRETDAEMELLAEKMQAITQASAKVSEALKGRRRRAAELSSTHALLKKLQFLFELPAKLKECIASQDYGLGVKYYVRAQKVLDQYSHMPSFSGIKSDSDEIMLQLRDGLRQRLKDPETSPVDMGECVNLLLALDQLPDQLCDDYLETASAKLNESLCVLQRQVELAKGGNNTKYEGIWDMLEFVDHGCNSFVGDTCLVIAAYSEIFIGGKRNGDRVDSKMATKKLMSFLHDVVRAFFEHLRQRVKTESSLSETAIVVRALDRFYRRMQAMCRLLPQGSMDFTRPALDLILEASEQYCGLTLNCIKKSVDESLIEIRKILVSPVGLGAGGQQPQSQQPETGHNIRELNTKLLSDVTDQIRSQTSNLQAFVDADLTFPLKTQYRNKFCRSYVREGVAVAFFKHLVTLVGEFCDDRSDKNVPPPTLLLLLSRTCSDLHANTIQYLLGHVDEQFLIDGAAAASGGGLTTVDELGKEFEAAAQRLLNHYVRRQGQVVSTMLRKSVETRDWLNTVEPRTVRAVMKRVVEEVTCIDRQIGGLYEEGCRKSRSSDSSRRSGARFSHQKRSAAGWSAVTPSGGGASTSMASNIQKMFNERVEVFSTVEFSRISILTGIVKISLKTLLECVRLRTFSRFGFQQMQVDVHYLYLYLWRFASDENLVTFLLDEIMTSALHRCFDAVPMEPSVVEVICDRG